MNRKKIKRLIDRSENPTFDKVDSTIETIKREESAKKKKLPKTLNKTENEEKSSTSYVNCKGRQGVTPQAQSEEFISMSKKTWFEENRNLAVNVSKMMSSDTEGIERIAPTIIDEVLPNSADTSNGFNKFWTYLLNFDPTDESATKYNTININYDLLAMEWKYFITVLMPDDANRIIHSIQEVFGIEELNAKFFTALSILKKSVTNENVGEIKSSLYPILEKAKNISNGQLFQHTAIFGSNISIEEVVDFNYTTLIKKLLPSHSIPIIEAVETLYDTHEKKTIATKYVLNRYCKMKYITLEEIEDTKQSTVSWDNFSITNMYKPVYDVIINKALPENLNDKKALIDEVTITLNGIASKAWLRDWLIEVHDNKSYFYGWQKINGSLNEEDFKSVSFEVVDVFYGGKVHVSVSFKFLSFIEEEQNHNQYSQSKLEKLNNVYRIALENFDKIVDNSSSVICQDNIITIKYKKEEDVNPILENHFRKVWGKCAGDESYKQQLLEKLKEKYPGNDITDDDVLEILRNENYQDTDHLKVQVTKISETPTNDVTLIQGFVLWPKETRRLNELPNNWFSKLHSIIIKTIPKIFHETVSQAFITSASLYMEDSTLLAEANEIICEKKDFLYRLLDHFRRNGGTVGDLRLAFKEPLTGDDINLTQELNKEKKPHIRKLIKTLDEFINLTYREWKAGFETKFPEVITTRKEFEDFFKQFGLDRMPKMNTADFYRKLERGDISNGDQIWFWRNTSFTDSYAHVGIFVDEDHIASSEYVRNIYPHQNSIVHVTSRNGQLSTTWNYIQENDTGKISCQPLKEVIQPHDTLFVVRFGEGGELSGEDITGRALACCYPKITFPYNGYFASCETFASKVSGVSSIEGLNLQGFHAACRNSKKRKIADKLHKGREASLDALIKKMDERLAFQIMPNIYENQDIQTI